MYTVQCLVNANKYTHGGFDSLGKHSTVKLEDCTITKSINSIQVVASKSKIFILK